MRVPHDDVADPIGGHRQTMTTASPINPETDGDTPCLAALSTIYRFHWNGIITITSIDINC